MPHLYPYRTLRLCTATLCFSLSLLRGLGQAGDTAGPVVPSNTNSPLLVGVVGGDPNAHSPFKAISLDRVSANGHKESGTVDVVFTAANQSTRVASLSFSINPLLSKASDDLDTIYHISQLRFGSNRRDSTSVDVIELRPDQALHCGVYINHVPLEARYIRKLVLFTSLKLDDANQGEDNIILTNLVIHWK